MILHLFVCEQAYTHREECALRGQSVGIQLKSSSLVASILVHEATSLACNLNCQTLMEFKRQDWGWKLMVH